MNNFNVVATPGELPRKVLHKDGVAAETVRRIERGHHAKTHGFLAYQLPADCSEGAAQGNVMWKKWWVEEKVEGGFGTEVVHFKAVQRVSVRGGVFDAHVRGARGIEVALDDAAGEFVFWLPEHRALVAGDLILGRAHGLEIPRTWLEDRYDATVALLRPLLELPVGSVLVTHGEPVLEDGYEELARALSA